MLTFVKAAVGAALIAVLWVTIDYGWRRLFGRTDPRLPGCGGCGDCNKSCSTRDRTED